MGKKQPIKIDSSRFKYIANVDIFCASFIKDVDLFPEGVGRDKLNARYAEYVANDLPYCSPCAISTGDLKPRRFEYKGKFIQFSPSPTGLPTIRDHDALIYCTTWIASVALDGRDADVGLTYEIDVDDFYRFANRPQNGNREDYFIKGLERLAGSNITTNTQPIGLDNYAFSLVEKFELNRDDAGRLKSAVIKFSHTVCSLAYNEFFDPIHPDYFTLAPARRLIYLFLKQYCGGKERLKLSFAKLHAITGSTSPLRKFLPVIDELVARPLPEFSAEKCAGEESLSFICTG